MSLIDESLFPPTSEADWRARIASERDGQDLPAGLSWIVERGLVLDAVATVLSKGSNPEVADPGITGPLPSAGANKGKRWRILSQGDGVADKGVVVVDVNNNLSPNHSVVQQCAIAVAMLLDQADSREETTHVRALVPVSHCLVLEVAKLMAMRTLLVNFTSDLWRRRKKIGEGSQTTTPGIELYAVAACNCECPDQETHQIRLTFACLASIFGGADAVRPEPFEDSDESRRLSQNVLLLLRHEAGLAAVQTIANGSYYLESAATKIQENARGLLTRVADAGGLEAALGEGLLTPAEQAESRRSEPGA